MFQKDSALEFHIQGKNHTLVEAVFSSDWLTITTPCTQKDSWSENSVNYNPPQLHVLKLQS